MMMLTTTVMMIDQIEIWATQTTKRMQAEHNRLGNTPATLPVLEIQWGKKFARIVRREPAIEHSGSAYAFIEIATGNILKASGWKAPAKGVRGHIADEDGSWGKGVNYYGAAYRY